MARLFLHFINRELHQSMAATPAVETYLFVIRLCSVFFNEPVVCNVSQIYELLFKEADITDELVLMSNADLLQLDSSHQTFDEFYEQRREYYAHDLERYPMYRTNAASDIFSRATIPPMPLVRSTTGHIESEILGIVNNDEAAPGGISRAEFDALRGMNRPIRSALLNREGAGLTFALFPARKVTFGSVRQAYALRRALSGAYVTHYMQQLGARIITGLPQIGYYDRRSENVFVGTDFRFIASVSRITGITKYLSGGIRFSLAQRIERWNSAAHQLFSEQFERLSEGLDSAYHASGSNLPHVSWAIAQIRGVLIEQTHAPSLTLDEVYLKCAASIGVAAEAMKHTLPGFEGGWNSVRTTGALRVLVTTATDVEDQKFDEIVLREGLSLVGSDRGGIESVQEYFGIPGVRLFQVRSSAGAVGSSGAALVSSDAIRRKDPDFVVCCGICFGMKPDKQQLGDVIVSDQVVFYEPGRMQEKAGEVEFIPRGAKTPAGPTLLDRARLVKRGWSDSACHVGLVASGEKLVDSGTFKTFLQSINPEAIGGEMESAGVFSAALRLKKEAIVIKGICDWGEAKDKKAQMLAAENAFSFAIAVVRKL